VLDGDRYLELTNTTGAEVIVLGYQGEPYLRFTPDRVVCRNTNSPATYLNEDRYGDADIPPGTSARTEPEWEQVSTDSRFAWRDHRAHSMSRTDPPQVATDPDRSSCHRAEHPATPTASTTPISMPEHQRTPRRSIAVIQGDGAATPRPKHESRDLPARGGSEISTHVQLLSAPPPGRGQ